LRNLHALKKLELHHQPIK